jgi:ADP-ribose pyrophosphatase YjhB (NUDIX family)
VLGVGAVIFDNQGAVLLVQRGQPPLEGTWTLPGGVVELGETCEDATLREIREETGLDIAVGQVVDVVDHVERDADGRVTYHFVVVDFLGTVRGGTLEATSDAAAVMMVSLDALETVPTTARTRAVVRRAYAMAFGGPAGPTGPAGPAARV